MRSAWTILTVALCLYSVSARAAPETPIDEAEVAPADPNPSSDACASAAAIIIAPQVFLEGDDKNLPEWIKVCNAHPDRSLCRETIKIISENQKQVPPGLTCE
ncbi:hypothetical protein [Bradyrhizobium sp.]|jgi:hypothetical protein|uniref:hypothetical protein n=1 Tax=Bradyrhizobium sp. TaxID=376 RepID=UPI003D09FAD0